MVEAVPRHGVFRLEQLFFQITPYIISFLFGFFQIPFRAARASVCVMVVVKDLELTTGEMEQVGAGIYVPSTGS